MVIRILLLCSVIAVGCLTPTAIPETTLQEQFPLTVGSRWTYATYDSLSQQRDTVLVTVVSSTTSSSGDTAYVCSYRHRTFADSTVVHVKNDTVLFATDATPSVSLLLPFTSVSSWTLDQSSTMKILGVGTDAVPAGMYVEAIHIQQHSMRPNDNSIYDYWIAPGFGVIQVYDETSLAAGSTIHKTNWVLLSCWIAP